MIKVAIMGTGGISDAHIKACLRFPDRCRITALADIYPDKAKEKAKRYGLDVAVYDDYRSALDGADFDLASICLPPFLHAPAAIACLNTGRHVLVEKPMASSLAECDAMLVAARTSGRILSVVAQNRFRTPMMKLKRVVEAGLIGRVVHAQIDSFWWRGSAYYDLWWRGTWEKEGGGCTLNHAVHHIDLFRWVLGAPAALQAVAVNAAHPNSEVEDFSTAVLFYDTGAVGQINSSLLHHGEEQRFLVQGERALVAVPWRVVASHQRENGFPEDDPKPAAEIQAFADRLPDVPYEGHDGQIENVLSAIEGKGGLLISGEAGRATIELITAIYASAFHNERVRLPLRPDHPYYTKDGILAHAPRFHEKTKSVENFPANRIAVGDFGASEKSKEKDSQ
jgi:UDP-N-acetyl-2-amino-2-deoxyglucuronate dehydrogenase